MPSTGVLLNTSLGPILLLPKCRLARSTPCPEVLTVEPMSMPTNIVVWYTSAGDVISAARKPINAVVNSQTSAKRTRSCVSQQDSKEKDIAQMQSTAVVRPIPSLHSVSGGLVSRHNKAGLQTQDALVTQEQYSKAAIAVNREPGRRSASKLLSALALFIVFLNRCQASRNAQHVQHCFNSWQEYAVHHLNSLQKACFNIICCACTLVTA